MAMLEYYRVLFELYYVLSDIIVKQLVFSDVRGLFSHLGYNTNSFLNLKCRKLVVYCLHFSQEKSLTF